MKVRHNISVGGKCLEYEVCGESASHWFTSIDNWSMQALPKDQFIVITPSTWQDVTGECVYADDRYLEHEGQRVLGRLADESYRLRKVQVYERIAVGNEQTADIAYTKCWAFLVERKVSE